MREINFVKDNEWTFTVYFALLGLFVKANFNYIGIRTSKLIKWNNEVVLYIYTIYNKIHTQNFLFWKFHKICMPILHLNFIHHIKIHKILHNIVFLQNYFSISQLQMSLLIANSTYSFKNENFLLCKTLLKAKVHE